MSTSAASGLSSAERRSRHSAIWVTRSTLREHWPEVAWAAFSAANIAVMVALPDWQTVPFHFIWVSLTVLYGYRLWAPRPTAGLLAVVGLITGATVLMSGDLNAQRLNELAEVPLMAAMFMVMVWHARRRHEALRQLRRAAQREREFVSDASHQLRTPITVARGHAELIRAASPGPQIERDADVVIDELARLGRTSDRLLFLAAAEHPGFLMVQEVDLNEVVRSAEDRWVAIPDREWRFVADAAGPLLADPERLDCALDALIENALKATGSGDRIAVEVSVVGSDAVITVADDGHGIPPEHLERIFDRFARVPSQDGCRNGGTGLGLPMVRAIAEAHQGTVSVSSRVGHGATFELRFAALAQADRRA